jgi:CBS domain-containing protein
MTVVSDIMVTDVTTIHKGETVLRAAEIMTSQDVGILVVTDAEASRIPVGIISDTDIIKKIVMLRKDPGAVWVKDIMSANLISIEPDATLADATNKMKRYKVRRLPVIKDGLLEGIISITDVIPQLINYKKKLLDLAVDF